MPLWAGRKCSWVRCIKAIRSLQSSFPSQISSSMHFHNNMKLPTCISSMGMHKKKKDEQRKRMYVVSNSKIGISRNVEHSYVVIGSYQQVASYYLHAWFLLYSFSRSTKQATYFKLPMKTLECSMIRLIPILQSLPACIPWLAHAFYFVQPYTRNASRKLRVGVMMHAVRDLWNTGSL